MIYKIKNKKGKWKWKSVYEAPTEKIRKEFKIVYGRYPTDEELNDILLEGEF